MILWDTTEALNALYGGLLIGLAVVIYLLCNGRIAGISGIVASCFNKANIHRFWSVAFIAGLILSPFVYQYFAPLPDVTLAADLPTTIIAGLLVGIGTRLGNGCTSGHGVCGVARLSVRSIVATIVFISTGIITVWLMHHLVS